MNSCLYGNGDFEQLKQFVNKNAELRNGVWSSPEGDKKTYSDGHTLISWRRWSHFDFVAERQEIVADRGQGR